MKVHSNPEQFNLDKYSYIDFILNCTDYKYDKKSVKAVQNKLWKIISPRLSKDEISGVSLLLDSVAIEAEKCLLKAVVSLNCVKIEL